MNLPLQLPYPGAATVADARGGTVAECPDPATAAALVAIVNAAWEHAVARGGSVFRHRATEEALYAAVEAAQGEGVTNE